MDRVILPVSSSGLSVIFFLTCIPIISMQSQALDHCLQASSLSLTTPIQEEFHQTRTQQPLPSSMQPWILLFCPGQVPLTTAPITQFHWRRNDGLLLPDPPRHQWRWVADRGPHQGFIGSSLCQLWIFWDVSHTMTFNVLLLQYLPPSLASDPLLPLDSS